MAKLVDFAALKAAMTIEQAAQHLGLKLNPEGDKFRALCPACKTEDRRAVVITPSKGLFYCFTAAEGGDLIRLAAHCRQEPIKDAAKFLWNRTCTSTGTVHGSDSPKPAKVPDQKLEKVAARLERKHPEVQALGLTPEMAEALGIGYDKKGILRGRVLIPLYKDGELAGFMGYAPDLEPTFKFPTDIVPEQTNVVPFRERQG